LAAVAAFGALGAIPLQAQALEVGGAVSVPVLTPTVPIKTPTVPIKAPIVSTTPTVPTKVPTVPIKAPVVSTTPTVPTKVPTVPIKAPAPVSTTTTPPAVKVQLESPKLPVSTSPTPIKAPSVSIGPSVTGKRSTPSSAPPAGPASGAGSRSGSVRGGSGAGVLTRRGRGLGGYRARPASLRAAAGLAGSGQGVATLGAAGAGPSTATLAADPFGAASLLPARYLQVPSAGSRLPDSSSGTNLFGIRLGPAARASLMIGLLIFGIGALLFGLLIADGLGLGPRHALWRQRFTRRVSSRFHWSPVMHQSLRPARSTGQGGRTSRFRRRI
jgi:hypothetical protein